MRNVFLVILVIHGLIHLMGFSKAFGLAEIEQLSQAISKPTGVAWLLSSLLFLAAAFGYFVKTAWWPFIAIVAVVTSQILIVIFWKDAKFGTLVNFIILIVALQAYGKYNFRKMTQNESIALLQGVSKETQGFIRKEDIENLPPIIQKWMELSGVVGKSKVYSVRLKQEGVMKTKPNGKWMPFIASQYVDVTDPSFVWISEVEANILMNMDGRDKLENGHGHMTIILNSLFPVVNVAGNEKIDSGSMQRYLAEICWFPSTAIEKHISWDAVGKHAAKATMKLGERQVSGVFTFSDKGDFVSFETPRYFGGGDDAKLETWFIRATDYHVFEGIRIPYQCAVTWKLKEGDLNWLNLEITDLEYNVDTIW